MPTLPLYTCNAVADASHRVVGPGGYEWWHFDAESPETGLTVVARLGAGFLFHSEYEQRYQRYRRLPTRHPPPVPAEYPCVEFAVWEGGQVLARYAAHFPPGQFFASGREAQARVGSSEFVRAPDGLLRMRLRGAAGSDSAGPSPSVDFDFRPLLHHAPCEVSLDALSTGTPRHHWVLADPLCEVTGRIVCGGNGRGIEFRGLGYHDHAYGAEPLGPRSLRWLGGRILLEGRAIAFQLADTLVLHQAPEVRLVEVDASGARLLQTTHARYAWPCGVARVNEAPAEVRLRTAHEEVILSEPRPLDSALASNWLTYSASVGTSRGRALCEVVDRPLMGRAWTGALPAGRRR